ncbi:MAG: helix-turn-helix domain-containing protein [Clostridia bacterium]|nr:helix-turn-helix domain-containing protein [Clostridia bacterium]
MALNKKQKLALELLTNGEGLSYKDICEAVNVNPKTLYNWRHCPEYAEFQDELKRINDERWLATIDVAREAAVRLCKEGKAEIVKFVLQNAGYNPTQKVEADLHTDIVIEIGDDEE